MIKPRQHTKNKNVPLHKYLEQNSYLNFAELLNPVICKQRLQENYSAKCHKPTRSTQIYQLFHKMIPFKHIACTSPHAFLMTLRMLHMENILTPPNGTFNSGIHNEVKGRLANFQLPEDALENVSVTSETC
jgi:hypothetical protein